MWTDAHELIQSGNTTILEIFKNKDRIGTGPGLLLMAAYIQFVVPKQTEVADYSTYNLDISDFKILKWEKDNDDKKLKSSAIFRRIRNSIAHARVKFASEKSFLLSDGPPQNKPFKATFEAEIEMKHFGKFLNTIMIKWMKDNVQNYKLNYGQWKADHCH